MFSMTANPSCFGKGLSSGIITWSSFETASLNPPYAYIIFLSPVRSRVTQKVPQLLGFESLYLSSCYPYRGSSVSSSCDDPLPITDYTVLCSMVLRLCLQAQCLVS